MILDANFNSAKVRNRLKLKQGLKRARNAANTRERGATVRTKKAACLDVSYYICGRIMNINGNMTGSSIRYLKHYETNALGQDFISSYRCVCSRLQKVCFVSYADRRHLTWTPGPLSWLLLTLFTNRLSLCSRSDVCSLLHEINLLVGISQLESVHMHEARTNTRGR